MSSFDFEQLQKKQKKLELASKQLKKYFIGIDNIIDELINQIRIWYLMPQLLTRPVIINLWGMTGVGKTDLVRRLVKILDFQDKFVEIELSNSSRSAYFRYQSSISDVLTDMQITPGMPCVLFFDEIQKFRTIDQEKKDIEDLQFQDFWELLSDGKLAKRDKINEMQDLFLDILSEAQNDKKDKKKNKIRIWEAKRVRKLLGLSEGADKLTQITNSEMAVLLEKQIKSKKVYEEVDYTKSLIITSGNLDEAYQMAIQTDEAEVDADIFYTATSKISIIQIKEALSQRFKPEQVSRFGNVHLIYPSLKKQDFQTLISRKAKEIEDRILKEYSVKVGISKNLHKLVYNNGVFPVQGVRPVFSALSDILETNTTKMLFEALLKNYPNVDMDYDFDRKQIVSKLFFQKENKQEIITIPFVGRLDKVRQTAVIQMATLTSVHEAGHALVYAVLFGIAPLQLKSKLASSQASGFTFPHQMELTKERILQKIQVLLAGNLAESLVFGEQKASTGHYGDLDMATRLSAEYVRDYGFDQFASRFASINSSDAVNANTDLQSTNDILENILIQQKQQARTILQKWMNLLKNLSKDLNQEGELTPQEFVQIATKHGLKCRVESEEFMIVDEYDKLFLNE